MSNPLSLMQELEEEAQGWIQREWDFLEESYCYPTRKKACVSREKEETQRANEFLRSTEAKPPTEALHSLLNQFPIQEFTVPDLRPARRFRPERLLSDERREDAWYFAESCIRMLVDRGLDLEASIVSSEEWDSYPRHGDCRWAFTMVGIARHPSLRPSAKNIRRFLFYRWVPLVDTLALIDRADENQIGLQLPNILGELIESFSDWEDHRQWDAAQDASCSKDEMPAFCELIANGIIRKATDDGFFRGINVISAYPVVLKTWRLTESLKLLMEETFQSHSRFARSALCEIATSSLFARCTIPAIARIICQYRIAGSVFPNTNWF